VHCLNLLHVGFGMLTDRDQVPITSPTEASFSAKSRPTFQVRGKSTAAMRKALDTMGGWNKSGQFCTVV
jgi:hypothetical protein